VCHFAGGYLDGFLDASDEEAGARNLNLAIEKIGKHSVFDAILRSEKERQIFARKMRDRWESAFAELEPKLQEYRECEEAIQRRIKLLGPNEEDEVGKHTLQKRLLAERNVPKDIVKYQESRFDLALSKINFNPSPLQIMGLMHGMGLRLDSTTFRHAQAYAQAKNDVGLKRKIEFLSYLCFIADMSFGDLKMEELLNMPRFNDSDIKAFRREFGLEDDDESESSEYGVEIQQGYQKLGLRRGVVSYEKLLQACVKTGHWANAISVFQSMKGEGLRLNVNMYHSAVLATSGSGDWYKGLELLAEMDRNGCRWNEETTEIIGQVGERMLNDTGYDSVMMKVDGVKFDFDRALPPPTSYLNVVPDNLTLPHQSVAASYARTGEERQLNKYGHEAQGPVKTLAEAYDEAFEKGFEADAEGIDSDVPDAD